MVASILTKHLIYIFMGITVAFITYGLTDINIITAYAGNLLVISIAVFTLAGIWVAYVYPQAISVFTEPEKVKLFNSNDLTEGVEKLILIIIASSFSIACVLMIYFIIFLFNLLVTAIPLLYFTANFGVSVAVILLIYCSLIQLSAICSVIVRNYKSVESLHNFKRKSEADKHIR